MRQVTWVFDLAMHVARRHPIPRAPGATRHRRLSRPGGWFGFCARVDAYRLTHNIKDAPFYLVTDRTSLVQDHASLIADIKRQIGKTLPALVVIDTLNRSLAGSESKDEDMAAYIRAADANPPKKAFGLPRWWYAAAVGVDGSAAPWSHVPDRGGRCAARRLT